jgi:hypothetical protein
MKGSLRCLSQGFTKFSAILILLTIITSGAIFFIVVVGIIKVDEKDVYLEITSQILNGCFTFLALYNQPERLRNLYRISQLLAFQKQSIRSEYQYQSQISDLEKKINQDYPFIKFPKNEFISNDSTLPLKENGNLSHQNFLITMILLNMNCIFQYPITISMWSYITNVTNRPPEIIYIFLPLSFLSGVIGTSWIGYIKHRESKKSKNKNIIMKSVISA